MSRLNGQKARFQIDRRRKLRLRQRVRALLNAPKTGENAEQGTRASGRHGGSR